MNAQLMIIDGYSYPRSPKEFKLAVYASKGAWSGMASAPIADVPPEIWSMDGEQIMDHPFVVALAELAQANMKANIAKALAEAQEAAS